MSSAALTGSSCLSLLCIMQGVTPTTTRTATEASTQVSHSPGSPLVCTSKRQGVRSRTPWGTTSCRLCRNSQPGEPSHLVTRPDPWYRMQLPEQDCRVHACTPARPASETCSVCCLAVLPVPPGGQSFNQFMGELAFAASCCCGSRLLAWPVYLSACRSKGTVCSRQQQPLWVLTKTPLVFHCAHTCGRLILRLGTCLQALVCTAGRSY